jgi:hypothetical protein
MENEILKYSVEQLQEAIDEKLRQRESGNVPEPLEHFETSALRKLCASYINCAKEFYLKRQKYKPITKGGVSWQERKQ